MVITLYYGYKIIGSSPIHVVLNLLITWLISRVYIYK